MTKPKIAILIPIHNGLNFTKKCLENIFILFHNPGEVSDTFKVIIIDDGSTDQSKDWIKENYPETVILDGNGHLWWSGGINKGITYAMKEDFDYVLWWNNDIHCASDYFLNLLRIIQENSTDIIVGSKIYFADEEETIWSMGGLFDASTGKKTVIGMHKADCADFGHVTEAEWLPGMGTLIHTSVFEKIGFVNAADFPQYHGDSDFTYKAWLAGYHIRVFPELRIWNDKSNSGLEHYNNFRMLISSLYNIKSNYHLGKDLLFYRRYASSVFAFKPLLIKYYFYIGGFLKWKILSTLGIKKSNPSNQNSL